MSFDLSIAGVASGFDWISVVNQLSEVNRAPQRRLRAEQNLIHQRKEAFSSLLKELRALSTKAQALSSASLYRLRAVNSTNPERATATAGADTPAGTFQFSVSQLATAAVRKGNENAGQGVDASAAMTSSQAGFAHAVTAGTFTVNGEKVTVEQGDSLEQVMDKIRGLTSVQSDASKTFYDAATDRITIESSTSDPVVFGSANDTSNFLQASRLVNNGSNQATSSSNLGGIQVSHRVDEARFNTALSAMFGGFEINGVTIEYAAGDTLQDIFNRINQSEAGVTASFDSVNDQFRLTNKTTGDIGFSLSDISGNFLEAAGLFKSGDSSVGTLERGRNAEFSVNGGETITSQSNRLGSEHHGLEGLVVNLSGSSFPGDFTLTVGSDPAPVRKAIQEFVEQYNKTQGLIETLTSSSTDAKGKVTAGILAGDQAVSEIAGKLRGETVGDVSGIAGTVKRLESLGYVSEGFSNTITLGNGGALEAALSGAMDETRELFSGGGGIANRLSGYLERISGENGSLVNRQQTFLTQSARIDEQIVGMEKRVMSQRDQLTASFVAMEKAQAHMNQQLLFLARRFSF